MTKKNVILNKRYFKSQRSAKSFAKKLGWRLNECVEKSGTRKQKEFNYVVYYVRDTNKNRELFAPDHLTEEQMPDLFPEEYWNE